MANIFRKHQKRLVKLFGVGLLSFLMIAFLLPEGLGRGGWGPDPYVARVGDQRVRGSEIFDARLEWEMLKTIEIRHPMAQQPYAVLARLQDMRVIEEIDEHEAMYFLLLQEARQMNVHVNPDLLGEMVQHAYSTRIDRTTPVGQEQLRHLLHNLLLVEAAYERAASVVKVSEPLRQSQIALSMQQIEVELVDFQAEDYQDQVAEPTGQQLQAHFEQYADVPPGTVDRETNPFGFGYLQPRRVALQYVAWSRDDVRQAVLDSQPEHEWEVAAHKYYLRHREQFTTTEPPLPAAPLTLGVVPPLAVNPTTGPRIREFWEVRAEILERILQPQLDRLAQAVQGTILNTLSTDYAAYEDAADTAATPAPQQGDAPLTAYGVPYHSYEYLQHLAADVQRRHGVLPRIGSLAEPKSEQELAQQPGLGQARIGNLPFATYVTQLARPFVPPASADLPEVLDILEPSPPLSDSATQYIVRVTQAIPEHRPESLDVVTEQVQQDLLRQQRFELARAQAQELLAAAEAPDMRLRQAAEAVELETISAGPLHRQTGFVPGYELTDTAASVFLENVFELLHKAGETDQPHPVMMVQMPQAGRIAVVELQDARALWSEEDLQWLQRQASAEIALFMEQPLRLQWFDFESLTRRMQYVPERQDEAPAPAPEAPAQPPGRMPIGR